MTKKNEYKEFIEILDYLNNNSSSMSDNEKELLKDMNEVVSTDRVNSIVQNMFIGNKVFIGLLDLIRENVNYYDVLIKNTSGSKIKDYIQRKYALLDLYEEVEFYINNQGVLTDEIEQDIVKKCLSSTKLGHKRQLLFFNGRMIGEDYSINKDIVNRVYGVLDNDNLMRELNEGVGIEESIQRQQDIITSCKEAIEYKDKIYENSELIIRYANVEEKIAEINKTLKNSLYRNIDEVLFEVNKKYRELTSNPIIRVINYERVSDIESERKNCISIMKSKTNYLAKLERLENEKIRLEKEIRECGLIGLYRGRDFKLRRKSEIHSLSNNLSMFRSKNNIDRYYEFIEKELILAKVNLTNERCVEREFLKRIDKETLNLMINSLTTCENIVKLSNSDKKDGIKPVFALAMLKGLVVLKSSNIVDKEISLEEMDKVESTYNKSMNETYEYYLECIKNIVNGVENNLTK